jgi:hypothetical protein
LVIAPGQCLFRDWRIGLVFFFCKQNIFVAGNGECSVFGTFYITQQKSPLIWYQI